MDLQTFESLKFEAVEILRALIQNLGHSSPSIATLAQELLTKLAEGRFCVAVVGRFSRGKTSLMNAILGDEWLPTGILPATSVLTVVTYGSRPRVLIQNANGGLRFEAKLADLPQYVSQDNNPGNRKNIHSVEVQLPVEILRRGFVFVDTPGLGSAIASNTAITERFLPEIDAMILVTSFEGVLSEEELDVLDDATHSLRRTFVVINKSDLVDEDQKFEVKGFVHQQLAKLASRDRHLVYAVSAKDALAAKRKHSGRDLQRSGCLFLETDLVRFLTSDKSEILLLRVCERMLTALKTLPGNDQIDALRSRLLKVVQSTTNAPSQNLLDAVVDLPEKPDFYTPTDACYVCRSVLQSEIDFFAHYQYELTTQEQVRKDLAERGGFCSSHSWKYEQFASPQGVCTGYVPTLLRYSAELAHIAEEGSTESLSSAIDEKLSAHCPACESRVTETKRIVGELRHKISSGGDSLPLCFPHLKYVIREIRDVSIARKMLMRYSRRLIRNAEDMRRCAMKQNARRRDLITEEEWRSHEIGLTLLAGNKHLADSK
jgi:GTP-binding protein EngB required for normal cell division